MRFEVFGGSGQQWFFRIVAANGETVAQSEGYERKQDALDTVEAIKAGVGADSEVTLFSPGTEEPVEI